MPYNRGHDLASSALNATITSGQKTPILPQLKLRHMGLIYEGTHRASSLAWSKSSLSLHHSENGTSD